MLLDEILFRDYKKVGIDNPLFIIGYPRSGTTYLHRVLAKDEERFTSMKFWEILFAPSITQKKIFKTIGKIDRVFGSQAYKVIQKCESRFFKKTNKFHKFSLYAEEEDDMILISIFSSFFLVSMFPFVETLLPLALFDKELPLEKRKQIMKFYKKCVQRHLYVFGKEKQFLSKNPAFTPKIESLFETFPSGKIICIVRSPLEAIPSAISWVSYTMNLFSSFNDPYRTKEIMEWSPFYYSYPLERLGKRRPEEHAILNYNDLLQYPDITISDFYNRFGFAMLQKFKNILKYEAKQSRSYQSKHHYELEQFGLSREQIVSEYRKIFDRFGFDTGENEFRETKLQ